MNGLRADLATLRKVAEALPSDAAGPEVLLCVPATLIAFAAEIAEASALRIGAQACHSRETGAHTGDLSAAMLKDAGASHVIVGHSERRADHGETSAFVAEQASAAIRAGLTPLICIGETLGQREKGEVSEVISRQLAGSLPADAQPASLVIAYEPV
jgi:triosephosphate isomerase